MGYLFIYELPDFHLVSKFLFPSFRLLATPKPRFGLCFQEFVLSQLAFLKRMVIFVSTRHELSSVTAMTLCPYIYIIFLYFLTLLSLHERVCMFVCVCVCVTERLFVCKRYNMHSYVSLCLCGCTYQVYIDIIYLIMCLIEQALVHGLYR